MNTSLDREAIMSEIRGGMEDMIEEGVLTRNDQVYQRIIGVVQRALAIQALDSVGYMTMLTNAITEPESQAYEGLSISQSNEAPIDDANNSVNLSDIHHSSATKLFQGDEAAFQDQVSLELDMSENFGFESGSAALEDIAPEGWFNVDSLDVPYLETSPHPLIATFGMDPALSYRARVNESGANALTTDDLDFDAYLTNLQDPSTGFHPFDFLEYSDEKPNSEMPIDPGTTLESNLVDFDPTTKLGSKKDWRRGLKGRCEYSIED
jgi:hypothetical protein